MDKRQKNMTKKPTIGIFKFTGCAGCQLELLHLEDVFINLLDIVDITYWVMVKRENIEGPWDISFVEGGVSTPEEIEEIKTAENPQQVKDELGDLFFVLVNLARWRDVDAESALREANLKFKRRFAHVERRAKEGGRNLSDMTLEEVDSFWNEAKKLGI